MKITIHDDYENKDFTIITGQRYGKEMYRHGGMLCKVAPWSTECPLTLDICICPDGEILIRDWNFSGDANAYLHTTDRKEDVTVTPEMEATIAGLFSGRILIDGLKIAVGSSVQAICQINLKEEEKRIDKKIYIANVYKDQ